MKYVVVGVKKAQNGTIFTVIMLELSPHKREMVNDNIKSHFLVL